MPVRKESLTLLGRVGADGDPWLRTSGRWKTLGPLYVRWDGSPVPIRKESLTLLGRVGDRRGPLAKDLQRVENSGSLCVRQGVAVQGVSRAATLGSARGT